jgi:hypothetical protein
MRTITIDIINNKAMRLLQDLEFLDLIRLRNEQIPSEAPIANWTSKYKGKMTAQPKSEIDKQLDELRKEWE